VSTAANVSLGYLSEIERGQKEASSELLAAICEALGAHLSELLRDVSDTVALAEQMDGVLVPVGADMPDTPSAGSGAIRRAAADRAAALRTSRPVAEPRRPVRGEEETVRKVATDGSVSVSVRQDTPLKATLRATRNVRTGGRGRDVVCVA
jgi:transcriptional regulator with XRE-family HTH domain